LIRDVLDT